MYIFQTTKANSTKFAERKSFQHFFIRHENGYNQVITTPTSYITVMLKTTQSSITHETNALYALNFTNKMVGKSFIGGGVKIVKWPWPNNLWVTSNNSGTIELISTKMGDGLKYIFRISGTSHFSHNNTSLFRLIFLSVYIRKYFSLLSLKSLKACSLIF